MTRRRLAVGRRAVGALVAGLVLASPAAAHELDHPAPAFSTDAPLSTSANSGGYRADSKVTLPPPPEAPKPPKKR